MPPDELRERLRNITGIKLLYATADDAREMIRLSRRILRMAGKDSNTQHAIALRKAVKRLHDMIPKPPRRRHGVACACLARRHSDQEFANAVLSAVKHAGDVLVSVIRMPKGYGRKIVVGAASEGGPGDPDPHRNRRGKGQGGIKIRTGIANLPYKFHPDHETIEFCPYKDRPGKKYRIKITQVEAWKIVNRLTAGMKSGKNDWYVKFTARDANILRSANAAFLEDCVERERCDKSERKGNRKWRNFARLRRTPKRGWK